jgi:NAD(P)H-quinone oxidoreductase subunit N
MEITTTGDLVQRSGGPASGRAQIQSTAIHHNVWPSPHGSTLACQTPLQPRMPAMPLLLSGRGFRQELERAGALALFAPLEGGAETRLLRRLRAAGYRAQMTSARGLGDPEAYLLQLHGVRPPHLGHQSVGRGAAVGEVQRVMPQLGALLEGSQPIVLWLLEGQVLSTAELGSLVALCRREPRLKIVVEMGGARALRWQPLEQLLVAA